MVTVIRTGYLHFAELVPIDLVEKWLVGISQLITLLRLGLGDLDFIGVADITAELCKLFEALLGRLEASDGMERRLMLPAEAWMSAKAVIEHSHLNGRECIC